MTSCWRGIGRKKRATESKPKTNKDKKEEGGEEDGEGEAEDHQAEDREGQDERRDAGMVMYVCVCACSAG